SGGKRERVPVLASSSRPRARYAAAPPSDAVRATPSPAHASSAIACRASNARHRREARPREISSIAVFSYRPKDRPLSGDQVRNRPEAIPDPGGPAATRLGDGGWPVRDLSRWPFRAGWRRQGEAIGLGALEDRLGQRIDIRRPVEQVVVDRRLGQRAPDRRLRPLPQACRPTVITPLLCGSFARPVLATRDAHGRHLRLLSLVVGRAP